MIGHETEQAAITFVEATGRRNNLITQHKQIENALREIQEKIRVLDGTIKKAAMGLKKQVTPDNVTAAFAIGKKTIVIRFKPDSQTTVDLVEHFVLSPSKNGKPDEGKSDD